MQLIYFLFLIRNLYISYNNLNNKIRNLHISYFSIERSGLELRSSGDKNGPLFYFVIFDTPECTQREFTQRLQQKTGKNNIRWAYIGGAQLKPRPPPPSLSPSLR